MKKIVVTSMILSVSLILMSMVSSRTYATKEFGEAFKAKYVDISTSEDFKKLVGEAKCNVCHIEGQDKKKNRNPYGDALDKNGLDAKEYKALLKDNPAKAKEYIEMIFKKVEDLKSERDSKTFGEKINNGELPGGDVKGK